MNLIGTINMIHQMFLTLSDIGPPRRPISIYFKVVIKILKKTLFKCLILIIKG